MPKRSKNKQYNQRRHLKKARSAIKKPLQESTNNSLTEDSNSVQDIVFNEKDLLQEALEIKMDLSAARSQRKSMAKKNEESTEYGNIPADELFDNLFNEKKN
ncbi:16449_t:CDS:2 [Dentiscutata heterogama]|uniref:16449_t:CDS:1 n=1 Tax=Dentiscutata heterogama TaxID=1316150 RepID=A0ACA9K2J7_9GLOM|nr:16449_t:CDS:2 [Dentiscutata heterogama]